MAIAHGKAALEVLKTFRSRKWFHDSFKRFADLLIQEYGQRNEVVKGGAISDAGSNNATTSNITCSETYVTLQGQSYHASRLPGSDAAITNKPLENPTGDQATLLVSYGSSGNDPASGDYTITSNSITFKVRIYNSTTSGEVYDVSSDADIQIDKGHADSTLTDDLGLIKAKFDALCAAGEKFAGYSSNAVGGANGSAATITLTAPVGHSNNFTDNSSGIANLSSTATDVVIDFSGIIYSDGSVGSGSTSTDAKKYISVIVTNSDNEGGVRAEGTNVQLLAVAAGTASTAGSTFLSADEIQSALAASSSNVNGYNHSGATGWVYLAEIEKATGGALTIVSNINNHLGR